MEKNILNSSTICRLCGEENSGRTSLYDKNHFNVNIYSLINKYLPIKISENDGLPKVICQSCILQLRTTVTFLNTIVKGQAKLKSLLENLSTKSLDISNFQLNSDPVGISHIKNESMQWTKNLSDPLMSNCPASQMSSLPEALAEDSKLFDTPSITTSLDQLDQTPGTSDLITDFNEDIKRMFGISLDEGGPLYQESMEFNNMIENIPNKKRRGRPKKDPNAAPVPKPAKKSIELKRIRMEGVDPSNMQLESKRKRKVPERFRESVQGAELDKILVTSELESEKQNMLANSGTCTEEQNIVISLGPDGVPVEQGEEYVTITLLGPEHANSNQSGDNSHQQSTLSLDSIENAVSIGDSDQIDEIASHVLQDINKVDKFLMKSTKKKKKKKKMYLKCEVCNQMFKQSIKFAMHKQTHNVLYHCSICSKNFHIFSNLLEHQTTELHENFDILDQNVQDPLVAEDYHVVSKYMSTLENGRYNCLHCGKGFSNELPAAVHIKLVLNKSRAYPCPRCNQTFEVHSSLSSHMMAEHKSTKTCVCPLCGRVFNTPGLLQYHMDTLHNTGQKYKCDKCDKEFTLKKTFNRHQVCHMETRPFKCSKCESAFKTNLSLSAHMWKHSKLDLHQCDICQRKLTHRSSLISHYRMHQGIKPYQCTECPKSFHQKGNLNEHFRIHTGEKPFSCTICEKKFTTYSQHKLHIKRHTGEKPYTCESCFKSFLSLQSLKTHKRRHCGDKPFACGYENCDMTFADAAAVKKHQKTHEGLQPYSCDICERKFSEMANLNRHKKICHNIVQEKTDTTLLNVHNDLLEMIRKKDLIDMVKEEELLPATTTSSTTTPISITIPPPESMIPKSEEEPRPGPNVFYLYDDEDILTTDSAVADPNSGNTYKLLTDGSQIHLVQMPVSGCVDSTDIKVIENPNEEFITFTEKQEISDESSPPMMSHVEPKEVNTDTNSLAVVDKQEVEPSADTEEYLEFVTEDGSQVGMIWGMYYNNLQIEPDTDANLEFS